MKLQLKRTACVMLAVVMLTGVFPVSASASGFISPPLNGATGSGWDNFNSSANEIIFGSNPVTLSLGPRFSPSDEPITPDIDFSDGEDISLADDNEDTGSEEADDPFDVEPSIATGESKTVNCQLSTINCQDMPVDLAAALLAYIEGANMAMASRPLFIPAAAPGDIGTIQFSNQPIDLPIDVNYWPVINWVNRPGQAKTPFCAQFGPNPQEGVPYAASAYNDDFVLRLLVAYEESIVSDRLAVQVAIWGHIHGWSSWMQWGPAATAINASGASISPAGNSCALRGRPARSPSLRQSLTRGRQHHP
ncbi:MAG: hypothetical protein FWD16_01910 [Clostridia bacterium]|nr:hypothetical protein [Clostridia bacterium]